MIVQAFTPSKYLKDWGLRFEDHKAFYEQYVRYYCNGSDCEEIKAHCNKHPRKVGQEPFYDLKTKTEVSAPRIYITHHPKKGEWEKLKTVDDLRQSALYVSG